jgi:hypothetical protein
MTAWGDFGPSAFGRQPPQADVRPSARSGRKQNGRSGACEAGKLPFVRPSVIGRIRPFPDIRPGGCPATQDVREWGLRTLPARDKGPPATKYRSDEHSADDDATAGRARSYQSHKPRLFFLQMPVIPARGISGICINNIANYATIVNHNLTLHNKIVPE